VKKIKTIASITLDPEGIMGDAGSGQGNLQGKVIVGGNGVVHDSLIGQVDGWPRTRFFSCKNTLAKLKFLK
jgi:hypothetical protein